MSFAPLIRLIRTAAFRLAAIYAGVFVVSVAILGLVVFFAMGNEGKELMRHRVRAEISALSAEHAAGGVARMLTTVERRALGAESLHYLIVDEGRSIFGDLASGRGDGWFGTTISRPGSSDDGDPALARTAVLPGDVRLTVGVGFEAVEELQQAVLGAFAIALGVVAALGAAGGVFVSRSFLSRIEAITRTAEAITSGDLNRRVPVRGAGDDFDRLSATLNRMLDRTQELMESLRQVSNDIAHDLRTPLARLRQKLEGARSRATSVAAYAAAVDGAIEETDAILSTFASLLRIAQIEAGTRRAGFVRIDLAALARSVAEAFAPSAEDLGKAVSIVAAEPAVVFGDRDLLAQVVANLVENAIAHGRHGGRITVAVEREGSAVSLKVADDGPGVPEAERERIFRRFYRLERSRNSPGNGLGLSLVSAVAELHDARVTLTDEAPGLCVRIAFAPANSGRPSQDL